MVLNKWMIGLKIIFCYESAKAEEVLLAAMDFPPFYGKDLENYRPLIDLIAQSYKRVDYDVKIRFLPWTRALAWSKSGDVDGMVGVWYSAE